MQFDDRLATVLRMQAGSERAAHTQFRQLLDLAGTAPDGADGTLLSHAYTRLGELSALIEPIDRAAIVRDPSARLRNPGLVAFLAGQELPVASAAMARARLSEAQWERLIPILPIPARALLRHREDLPRRARDLLARLGVGDLVLPEPPLAQASRLHAPLPASPIPGEDGEEAVFDLDPALEIDSEANEGIGALVRRIAAFQRARKDATAIPANDAPRLPLGEQQEDSARFAPAFDFSTDMEGRIAWADPAVAPMVVGILLGSQAPEAPARADSATIAAMRRRQPVRAGRVVLEGAPAITGEWCIDAAPHFSIPAGHFSGYHGRMRRPAESRASQPAAQADSPADRMRQVLHELRTPVNAIQGFAEIIQQQLFGPAPNEYRALAASIAGDAARMLAGFEELDRLMKLEGGALELEAGSADFRAIVAETARQLDGVLRPRSAGLALTGEDTPCPVALTQGDAQLIAWRLLATLAGATSPGEELRIGITQDGAQAMLEIDLPAAFANRDDLFASAPAAQPQPVTAGMFGAGFTLRLARAEAAAAGGALSRKEDTLALVLPAAAGQAGDKYNKDADLAERIAETG